MKYVFSNLCRLNKRTALNLYLLFIMLGVGLTQVFAQNDAVSKNATSDTSNAAEKKDNANPDLSYRIGVGDVLDIKFFPRTQLNIQAKVAEDGTIRLLMIDKPVMAACKTEPELAAEIAQLYKKYQKNPSVNVFILEYNALRVGVTGSVDNPSYFLLKKPMRLLDVIMASGGPTKDAGSKVYVTHTGSTSICDPKAEITDEEQSFSEYSWRDIRQGNPASNPYLKSGDYISIPKADQVYVVGNVEKPQTVLLDEPKTLRQAIAAAGGWLKTTKKDKIKVIRQKHGEKPVELIFDLVAIEKGKMEDPYLQANDIVTVPEDGWKAARKKVLDAFTQGLSGVPVILR